MVKKFVSFIFASSIVLAGCDSCTTSSVVDATVDSQVDVLPSSEVVEAGTATDASSQQNCESFDSTVRPGC